MQEQKFDYFAFISYNKNDVRWGKQLQRRLERYKMSTKLSRQTGLERKPIKRVFFAPTEIQLNELTEELKSRLRASRNLIVICSPNSAKSEWVGKEIEYFYSLGRKNNIFFFIIDGVPNSNDPETECYNPKIKELGLAGRLGANINEQNFRWAYLNRERAYIQLITSLLGVEFDQVWQRHKRQLIERSITIGALFVAVCIAIFMAWNARRPIDIAIGLEDLTAKNENIPQLSDAEVVLYLEGDTRRARISSIDDQAIFSNVPRNLLGSNVKVGFIDFPDSPEAMNYFPTEQEMELAEQMRLGVCRDTVKYGVIRACLISPNGRVVPNYSLTIAGCSATSDANGNIVIHIPFRQQHQSYVVMNDTLSDVGLVSKFAIVVQ